LIEPWAHVIQEAMKKSLSMMSYTGLFFLSTTQVARFQQRRHLLFLTVRVNHEVTFSFTLSLGLLSPPVPYFNGILQSKESLIKSQYEMLKLSS